MSDGIATILKEMIKIDYVPNKEDFPEFIDAITYQCFLKKYNDLKR